MLQLLNLLSQATVTAFIEFYFLETAYFAAIAFQNEILVLGQLCKCVCTTRNQDIQSLSNNLDAYWVWTEF